jgi:hypothetical protein
MMPLGFWDVRRFYFMIPWDVYYWEKYEKAVYDSNAIRHIDQSSDAQEDADLLSS